MKILRVILFPFSVLYGIITDIRNFMYDRGLLTSFKSTKPVIAVGNLSVGGTGKSPQIEYLIRLLLDQRYKVATLSRGYKRKSEGFLLANSTTKMIDIGDEPYQFYSKFPNINVAVDANRVNGIKQLLSLNKDLDVILLDDAYQHRKVAADMYILLTTYHQLYKDDFMLPTGNLRETRKGACRARIVVVTKCPKDLSDIDKQRITKKLSLHKNQDLFFSAISYDESVYSKSGQLNVSEIKPLEKVVLAGIAKPEPFFSFISNPEDLILKYKDHHNFTSAEIEEIKCKSKGKIIITTEKDYVRIKDLFPENQLYYLPIRSEFLDNGEQFNEIVLSYLKR